MDFTNTQGYLFSVDVVAIRFFGVTLGYSCWQDQI